MSDTEILEKLATLWIEFGGDAEGVTWCWQELRDEVERQLSSDNMGDESPTKGLNMTDKLTENQSAKSVDSIDWLSKLDAITLEIRDDAEDAIGGCVDDRSAPVMIETIERVRKAMGVNQLW